MKKNRHHIFIILILASVLLCSCVDELFVDNKPILGEEDLTECRIGLDVENFQLTSATSTRAVSAEDTIASEAERRVNDIWVFQYGTDSSLLIKPRYYESSSKDGENWNVLLNISNSIIYVVANTGDAKWIANYEDFSTLSKLKKQSLPTPDPIQVGDSAGQVKASEVSIPMAGSKDVESSAFVAGNTIEIPVVRMYAKLIISSQMIADMTMTSIEVNNIPYTCQIEARSTDPYQSTASDYSSATFITRSYYTVGDKTTFLENSNDSLTQDYVIYVPENIQGINSTYLSDGQTLKGKDYSFGENGCPTHALDVNYHLRIKKDNSDAVVNSSAYVFPGANNTNNFNVNRNYVYKVKANFLSKEYFFPTPSSNCFVVTPGETLTFWPYYRVETGGGYAFSNYLDPTNEDKTIDKLKIIWQDKDVIGDNTNGDLVYISDAASDKTGYDEIVKNFTIDVKTQKEGNALIGAYNSKDEIIWSWHIWVTSLNPDNVGNAIRYTTYEWDNNGVYANKARVPGYQVMPCNLGATALVNTSSQKNAYGLLYQWGRKDPFPPLRTGGSKTNYTTANTKQHYGNDNLPVNKTSADIADSLFHTHIGKGLVDAVGYSIANPTVFIAGTEELNLTGTEGNTVWNYGNYFNYGDWCPEGQSDNKLWGGLEPDDDLTVMQHYDNKNNVRIYDNYGTEKSIFDPCPSGWRVPPGDLWLGFTSTGQNPASFSEINSRNTDNTHNNVNNGVYMYLEGWKTGTPSYFPTPGSRVGDGMGIRNGQCGNYHNASTGKIKYSGNWIDNVNILHIHANAYNLFNIFEYQFVMYHVKSCAGPIRCVRDKK